MLEIQQIGDDFEKFDTLRSELDGVYDAINKAPERESVVPEVDPEVQRELETYLKDIEDYRKDEESLGDRYRDDTSKNFDYLSSHS